MVSKTTSGTKQKKFYKHKQGNLDLTRSKRGFMGLTKLIEACLDTGLIKSKMVSFSIKDMRLGLGGSSFFSRGFKNSAWPKRMVSGV